MFSKFGHPYQNEPTITSTPANTQTHHSPIHTHTHPHTHTHTHTHTHHDTFTHTLTHPPTHTHMHTHPHSPTRAHTLTHPPVHTPHTHTSHPELGTCGIFGFLKTEVPISLKPTACNLYLCQSYLESHSQINLIKNAKHINFHY